MIDSSDTADDLVVLVDERDETLGAARKIEVHTDGRLHRAVSVMLFDSDERVLLQRRAESKYHSPGLWSNTCCGHPRPNETGVHAARRRLRAEMGIERCELTLAARFIYQERVTSDLVEHELDNLFVGRWNADPNPNPEEVSEWRWMHLASLRRDVRENPQQYTAWLSHVLEHLPGPASGALFRWGLCCIVLDAPIRFRAATHSYVWQLGEERRIAYLNDIALHNANALIDVLQYCRSLDIRAFRVSSQIFPLATHPLSGYRLDTLPEAAEVHRRLDSARQIAVDADIRLSFHPDQFIVLNSTRPDVVASAIVELEWQAEIAEAVGADVICLHGGSTAGGAEPALDRLIDGIGRLSHRARSRLALENDDRCFAAIDLLPVAMATDIPLVLDAHHHRVLSGDLSIEEATDWALATWGDREPHFHISSPRDGWQSRDPRPHADVVDPADVPRCWSELEIPLTIDVEAKAKERAVVALAQAMRRPFT